MKLKNLIIGLASLGIISLQTISWADSPVDAVPVEIIINHQQSSPPFPVNLNVSFSISAANVPGNNLDAGTPHWLGANSFNVAEGQIFGQGAQAFYMQSVTTYPLSGQLQISYTASLAGQTPLTYNYSVAVSNDNHLSPIDDLESNASMGCEFVTGGLDNIFPTIRLNCLH